MAVDLLSFALEEYQRQHERATLAVAATPALRPRAEATCRAWLSIILRLGGTHPHAAPWLDEVPIFPPRTGGLEEGTQCQRDRAQRGGGVQASVPNQPDRILTAHTLAPLEQVHKALSHARDQAFAAALGHESDGPELLQTTQFHRFDTLKKLARRLGCFTPVMLPEPAPKLEQAA